MIIMIYWFNGGRIMIKTLKMKNCASYDSMGISIEECKKVNFIYGPNGSGKSTISNFLYDQKTIYIKIVKLNGNLIHLQI